MEAKLAGKWRARNLYSSLYFFAEYGEERLFILIYKVPKYGLP